MLSKFRLGDASLWDLLRSESSKFRFGDESLLDCLRFEPSSRFRDRRSSRSFDLERDLDRRLDDLCLEASGLLSRLRFLSFFLSLDETFFFFFLDLDTFFFDLSFLLDRSSSESDESEELELEEELDDDEEEDEESFGTMVFFDGLDFKCALKSSVKPPKPKIMKFMYYTCI